MTQSGDASPRFDPDAIHEKYQRERDKRMIPGRADIRDLTSDGVFAKYKEDPHTPFVHREPLSDEMDVIIVGAGIAGVLTAAKIREAGIGRIRLIDTGGGVGGTWYWNRYPGVMCDVESYSYMPMLEEMNYIPTRRYAFGDEIREHVEAIARKYDLYQDALFHTNVQKAEWDEDSARWVVHTDRGDHLRAKYLVMAVGILNLMKLPDIPGMELFKGKSFHTARWDYEYTGGDLHGNLDKLSDKVVGIIGTGATAIQAIPALAEGAKHLYVFQRTPSAVGVRGNRETPDDFAKDLKPGWQIERMDNFTAIIAGRPVDRDLIQDGWTKHWRAVVTPPITPDMPVDQMMRVAEEVDFEVMEEHRRRIDEEISDPNKAEILKPWYRYLCKRPCFHDEYLPAFNNPNVTLVDCPAGIERVTEDGLITRDNGEYKLDCLIYATGFEAEMTPLPRRAGFPLIGRDGVTIAEKWKEGPITLHGVMTRGFPNLFLVPAPGQQAIVSVNITHCSTVGADHIAQTMAMFEKRGIRSFDVTAEAEGKYTEAIISKHTDNSAFMSACTPSRLNFEGHPEAANPRSGSYGGGLGDVDGWRKLTAEWRNSGAFPGLEIEDEPVKA